MSDQFKGFPKMPRLNRPVIFTEKIDGTNAQICLLDPSRDLVPDKLEVYTLAQDGGLHLLAGSRTRYIIPESDNYGFAAWVLANATELFRLGRGHHFGEWWGRGINRNYGLQERRFSLFNTIRWTADTTPACCSRVPVLHSGVLIDAVKVVDDLIASGSRAAPGFMKPEGVVAYHTASNHSFKVTIENDDLPKGQVG